MKKIIVGFLVALAVSTCNQARAASTPLYIPSLGANATGTDVGGKKTLDVSIPAGLSLTDPAEGLTGDPAPATAILTGGSDGTDLQALHVDSSGNLNVIQSGAWTTGRTWTLLDSTDSVSAVQSGTWNLNNISGTISLPTGAATAANQTTGNTSLSSIDTKTPALVSGRVPVDGSGVTQPVSAASLPLPTGAATEATLSTLNGKVTAVDTGAVVVSSSALPTGAATSANQSTANTSLASIDGKITAVNTGAVVVSSSALPSGAATSAKQPALGTAGTASSDVITVQGIASMTALKVDGSAVTQPVSGTVAATQSGSWSVSDVAPTAKTVKQAAITVGTSAVRLTTDGSAPDSDRAYLAFQPSDANTGSCYWGSSSVASSGGSRGLLIYPGQSQELKMDAGEYYAICDTAAQTLFVVEQE